MRARLCVGRLAGGGAGALSTGMDPRLTRCCTIVRSWPSTEDISFQEGEQVLLIDGRGKRHLIFLRKSETFHSDRGWIPHDALVGQPEGSWVRSPLGMRYLAVRPTLAEYVLEMPRGAQVIYPKDLAVILFWADI
jgi:TrmI-like N-terminal